MLQVNGCLLQVLTCAPFKPSLCGAALGQRTLSLYTRMIVVSK
jgi:hypothetical protein